MSLVEATAADQRPVESVPCRELGLHYPPHGFPATPLALHQAGALLADERMSG